MNGSLKGKKIFMTGATSGLGKVSALKAAGKGATLIALARDRTKGLKLINDYKDQYPTSTGKIDIVEGDLSSFESVSKACNQVMLKYPTLDMVVNNAGIMNFEFKYSKDQVEETFQVNLLSPIMICDLLLPSLKRSNHAKIIMTSSGLHQGEINFQNLEFKGNFSSFKSYRQSKLGVILICRLLADMLKDQNIFLYSQHPGMVRTELGRKANWLSRMIFYLLGKSPERGSQTLSFLIESDNSQLVSGEYYCDKKVKQASIQSYDLQVAAKLLEVIHEYLRPYIKPDSLIFAQKETV